MNKKIKKFLKKNKLIIVIYFIVTAFLAFSTCYFIKNLISLSGIETFLRIIIIALLSINLISYVFKSFNRIVKTKYKKFLKSSLISIILGTALLIISIFINVVYSSISNLGESSELSYTSKLVKMNGDKFDKDSKIGMIENESDIEGYILANKLLEKEKLNNEITYYDSYLKMIYDLYNEKIDAVFLKSNYISLYESEEGLENLHKETEVIYSLSEEYKNNDIVESSNKTFKEPLTFLIMGVDSETDGLSDTAAFNGDTLMIITFNPDTLNATMFSIPRDIMVPITCNNNKVAKINSAAAFGTSCVINTIENLIDIDIDYYLKVNFKGAVDLVDALDGIEVDVEKPDFDTYGGKMCEQDSNRWFEEHLICIEPGLQILNGEQALAYARNRKLYAQSDIDRIVHQQQVVTAITNKALGIKSYSTLESILKSIEKNLVTNMSTEQILSSYSVFKNMLSSAVSGKDILNIEKSYLEYYDLRVYMPSYGMEIAGLGYYEDSLNDIIDNMKVNLDLKNEDKIKTFSYEIEENYVQKVAGEGFYGNKSYEVLKNFVGLSESEAKTYCSSNKLTCKFEIVDKSSKYYKSSIAEGLISNQSVRENTLLSLSKNITFYINEISPIIPDNTDDESNNKEEIENEELVDNNEIIDEVIEDIVE